MIITTIIFILSIWVLTLSFLFYKESKALTHLYIILDNYDSDVEFLKQDYEKVIKELEDIKKCSCKEK